jgi:hypothetical protein
MTMTGHCVCGAVRYRTDAEPTLTANCHCTDCQRQTGSAFSILVAVPREALHIHGELATHVTIGTDTELEVKRQFGPRCGSPIVSLPDMTPDLAFTKAGTLDNAADLVPEWTCGATPRSAGWRWTRSAGVSRAACRSSSSDSGRVVVRAGREIIPSRRPSAASSSKRRSLIGRASTSSPWGQAAGDPRAPTRAA